MGVPINPPTIDEQRNIAASKLNPMRTGLRNVPRGNEFGDVVETSDIVVRGTDHDFEHRTNEYVLTVLPSSASIPVPVIGDKARCYIVDKDDPNRVVDYQEWVYADDGGGIVKWRLTWAGSASGLESDPVYNADKPNIARRDGNNTFNGNETFNGNVTFNGNLTKEGDSVFNGNAEFNAGVTKGGVDVATVDDVDGLRTDVANTYATQTDHTILENRVDSLEMLGQWVGTFDTVALIPTHTSAFPDGVSQNDFVNVRADEHHANIPTRYIAQSIDGGGNITWVFDIPFSTDISGKADKVANATDGNFAGLDSHGNLTDSGFDQADFATAAQGVKADAALVAANGVAYDSSRFGGMTKSDYDTWVTQQAATPLISTPNLWTPNTVEYDFGNGLYGRRFTGNITAAVNVVVATVLFSPLPAESKLINCGGGVFWPNSRWYEVNTMVPMNYAIGTSTFCLSVLDFSPGTNCRLLTVCELARTNSPYDIWLLYTK